MKSNLPDGLALIVRTRFLESAMDAIKGYLNAKSEDEFQNEDDTITYTAVFPDGKQMDVKCCGSQDEVSWREAVLFDRNGSESSKTRHSCAATVMSGGTV